MEALAGHPGHPLFLWDATSQLQDRAATGDSVIFTLSRRPAAETEERVEEPLSLGLKTFHGPRKQQGGFVLFLGTCFSEEGSLFHPFSRHYAPTPTPMCPEGKRELRPRPADSEISDSATLQVLVRLYRGHPRPSKTFKGPALGGIFLPPGAEMAAYQCKFQGSF